MKTTPKANLKQGKFKTKIVKAVMSALLINYNSYTKGNKFLTADQIAEKLEATGHMTRQNVYDIKAMLNQMDLIKDHPGIPSTCKFNKEHINNIIAIDIGKIVYGFVHDHKQFKIEFPDDETPKTELRREYKHVKTFVRKFNNNIRKFYNPRNVAKPNRIRLVAEIKNKMAKANQLMDQVNQLIDQVNI